MVALMLFIQLHLGGAELVKKDAIIARLDKLNCSSTCHPATLSRLVLSSR